MKIGYARISSADQNPSRQLEELEKAGVEKIFSDIASGKDQNRQKLQLLLTYARDGDEVIICSMDRLGRNLRDLLQLIDTLRQRKASITFLKENLHLEPEGEENAMTTLLVSIFGAFSEFERNLIRERQREGIELAKKRGVYKGRKPIDEKLLKKALERVELGIPLAKVAREFKIGRTTLSNFKRKRIEKVE